MEKGKNMRAGGVDYAIMAAGGEVGMTLRTTGGRPVAAVIDGQGGGFGAALIKEARLRFGEALEVWALGTNSAATAAMMRAGANRGATGENALRTCLPKTDVILGPIAVTWPDALMGEITAPMAAAVMAAGAPKVLIPLSQEGVTLAGFQTAPLPHLVRAAMDHLARLASERE